MKKTNPGGFGFREFFVSGDFLNARIKLSAKSVLTESQGRVVPWVSAMIILFLIFTLCGLLLNKLKLNNIILFFVSLSVLILSVISSSALNLSMQKRMLMFASNVRIFKGKGIGFEGVLKSVVLDILLFGIKLFWLCVFEILPVLGGMILYFQIKKEPISVKAVCAFSVGIALLAIIGFVFYSVFIQKYSKSMFYLACYRNFSPVDAIRESVRKTQGICGDILIFKLGFLPWFLLCITILPALYVVPYYKQSLTCLFLSR